MKNFSFLVLLLLLTIIFSSSSVLLYSQGISYGDSASLGNGTIKGWIKTNASNNPQSIGLTLTEDALTNLPSMGTETHLNLPKNASDTLFNHLLFDWNPGGHPPPGIYNLPHFDLHFYMISKAEREAILGGPDPIIIEARFVAPDYVKDPGGVPKMGTHWTDRTAPEFNGQVFTKTFIYGSDKGKFIFVEPMFTKAYLETHPHFTGNIKQPAEFQRGGYYPTSYKIDYDSVAHVFNIEITDFVLRQASPIVPVELTSFTAHVQGQSVILNWVTATELNNHGFEIQRKVVEGDFATVGFIKGEGTTTNQKEYSYADKNLAEGKYYYRLKQLDFNGEYDYSSKIEVEVRSLDNFVLEQNYPNPFNPTTTIGYVLQEKASTKLTLMNAIGEEVAILVNEEQEKGYHKVDLNAHNLPSGVYLYKLQAGNFTESKKLMLLK